MVGSGCLISCCPLLARKVLRTLESPARCSVQSSGRFLRRHLVALRRNIRVAIAGFLVTTRAEHHIRLAPDLLDTRPRLSVFAYKKAVCRRPPRGMECHGESILTLAMKGVHTYTHHDSMRTQSSLADVIWNPS